MEVADLRARQLVPQDVLRKVEQDMQRGGSLLNHLHHRLGANRSEVWAAMASGQNRSFFKEPSEIGPLDARLLPVSLALDHLLLPRRREYLTVRLITPDPFYAPRETTALQSHVNSLVPGGHASLVFDVTTPTTFKELFSLVYPNHLERARTERDHLAVSALIPVNSSISPSKEEQSEAVASFHGLPFTDPDIEAPDPQLLRQFPIEPFLAARLYPHSRTQQGELLVLGAVENHDELPELLAKVDYLSSALLHPMRLALTSKRRIAHLMTVEVSR